jgi:pyridine nucleotide-disulfide oxidoreductase
MSVRTLVLILAIALLPATAVAQIQSGPLSRAHKELDGATHCTTCHKLGGGQPTFKCLDCHTEIASRLAAHQGPLSDHYVNKKILVVGGCDSAAEAAMGLAHQPGNKVTLCYRGAQFSRIKERNSKRIEECESEDRWANCSGFCCA